MAPFGPSSIEASTSTLDVDARAKHFSFKNISIEEVLEDLSSRFILNLPEEELVSVERICFQVEQAHWYYEDYIRDEEPSLPSLPLKTFSGMLFQSCPLLVHWSPAHDQAFQDFMAYKTTVPVCGAIMIDPSWTKCVLVKGWKSSAAWSFPRGKINLDEPEHECAAREVMEETGYDISDKIHLDAVIRVTVKDQRTSLFVIPNVPEDTVFETKTRKEISKIQWFNLSDLPAWKKNTKSPTSFKFYAISSFVGPLKSVIKRLRAAEAKHPPSQALSDQSYSVNKNAPTYHPLPDDPAIVSATLHNPESGHLSRLLGSLNMTAPADSPSLNPVTTPSTQGALPTPQTTPSMVHATKNDLKPASSRLLFEEHVKGSFSSPTPPNSEEIDDSPNECSRPPSAKPKLKFDFISPFDAFGSAKVANESPAQPAASPPGTVGTKPLMSPTSTSTSTASTSQHSPSALRSNGSSMLEHFAPPSVEARRISNARKASVSSVTNSVSSGAKSITNVSPDPHSNRQAQRIALLQSLSTQLLPKSSSPHPSASSQPRIEDSPFVVNPARAPAISPSQLFTPRAPQLDPSRLHMGATLPRHITSLPIYPILAQPREPVIPLQPRLDPVPNNYRMISGTKPLMPFPIPGIPPPNSHSNVAPRNDILNLLNGPQVRSTPVQAFPLHNTTLYLPPVPIQSMDAPPIHAPASHRYNSSVPYPINGDMRKMDPVVNPQSQPATISGPKPPVTQPSNVNLLAILNRPNF